MCMNSFAVAMMKYPTQNQLGGERVHFSSQFQRDRFIMMRKTCQYIEVEKARQQEQEAGQSHFHPHLGTRERGDQVEPASKTTIKKAKPSRAGIPMNQLGRKVKYSALI